MTPDAVVFDCDGVLVDSEPHSRRSWVEVLGSLGHPAAEEDVAACTGLGFLPTRDALDRLGPLPEPDELWPLLMDALRRSFDRGLDVFADAMEALGAVEASEIPVAVASASPRERLDLTLDAAGLSERFAASVAGDEVARGKPAPDCYLVAAGRLGVPSSAVAAVEDSVAGIRSAQAAGMRVVAVVREERWRAELAATGALVVDTLRPEHLGLETADR